jgi:hypothetical protein
MRVLNERVGVVIDLFRDLFECEGRGFGNPAAGISDGVEGVQWNAGYDEIAWIGVNLEGMQYDGWPIARLIKREISNPLLLSEYRDRVPKPETVTVNWSRDAWQARSRPLIKEARIAPTPIALDRLDADGWARALLQARECLDPERGYQGRRRTKVTLARLDRIVELGVTPHLWFRTRFAFGDPDSMRRARDNLKALHDFVCRQAGRRTAQTSMLG